MRIGFWLTTPRRFDPAKIEETPFGGAEISALHLARQLRGLPYRHDVTVYANCDVAVADGLMLYPYSSLDSHSYKPKDVLVVVRADQNLLNPRRMDVRQMAEKVVLWTGDAYDQPNNQILHDVHSLKQIDLIVTKSNWQMESLARHFPLIPGGKLTTVYNGVNADRLNMQTVDEPRFVYASTAYRGLRKFKTIWPMVQKMIPNATLDCYCKTTLYMEDNPRDEEWKPLYSELAKLPGLTIKEPLPQGEFLNRLGGYYAMLYPNCDFVESSCGVGLQALASGLPLVTSAVAGLKELQGAILVCGEPDSDEYDRRFVGEVEYVWKLKGIRKVQAGRAKDIAERQNWKEKAKEWEQLLTQTLEKQQSTNGFRKSASGFSPVAA